MRLVHGIDIDDRRRQLRLWCGRLIISPATRPTRLGREQSSTSECRIGQMHPLRDVWIVAPKPARMLRRGGR
jgi:hypothetical protein